MTIEKNLCGSTAEIKLSGWLNTQTAPDLGAEIDALGAEITALTIDCEKLEFISSAGLRQIVAAHKKVNGALTLCRVSDEIKDVFRMTGLDKHIAIQ